MSCVAATLTTRRLRLRQFAEADLDAYARITGDDEVMRYVGGKALSRDEAWCSLGYHIGHWKLRGYGLFAVDEKETGELVGRVGLYRPEGWPGLELGWLVDRARWGEGIASEAARAVMAHAFTRLCPKRLISVIEPANAASIRVAEKLGERFERRMPLQGKEVCIYGIDRDEWEGA